MAMHLQYFIAFIERKNRGKEETEEELIKTEKSEHEK